MSTEIKIYWNSQDRNNEGWSFSSMDENFRGESGELTNPNLPMHATEQQLRDALVTLAWELGHEINGDDGAYSPEDGGCIFVSIE